jgi:predicted phosphodiesterase
MRIAIISDIHGNYEALKSVAQDIEAAGVDKTICLGDVVGYGPQPEETVQFIRQNDIPCVMGNHEYAILNESELEHFSEDAKTSLIMTKSLLSGETIEFMSSWPKHMIIDNTLFVHGCPPDIHNVYFNGLTSEQYDLVFGILAQRIAFVGHTHRPLCFFHNGRHCDFKLLYKGTNKLHPSYKYVINVGSVGQSRDGNCKAKYVIYDTDAFTVNLRLVAYNIEKMADLIRKLGFPEYNADRLYGNWIEVLGGGGS